MFFQRLAILLRLHAQGIFFEDFLTNVTVKASVHDKNLSGGNGTDPITQPDPEVWVILLSKP
jgi:hypothetical protein